MLEIRFIQLFLLISGILCAFASGAQNTVSGKPDQPEKTALNASQNSAPNYARLKFQEVKINLPGALGSGFIQDKQGFLWFGLQSGLAKWDGKRLQIFDTRNSQLSSVIITGLLEDRQGKIWVATRGGGLNLYDKKNNSFTQFRHDPKDPASIVSDSLGLITVSQSLAIDQQERIWIASNIAGVSRYDPKTGKFSRFQHDANNPYSLSSNKINAIFIDRQGRCWIGTQNGLNLFHPENGNFTHFQADSAHSDRLSDSNVNVISQDRDGLLWLGTVRGGLNSFDPETQKFTHYKYRQDDGNGTVLPLITAILEDQHGALWITHGGDSISIFDKKNAKFHHHQSDNFSLTRLHGERIQHLFKDSNGVIWVGALDGRLNKYDPTAMKFTLYTQEKDNPKSIPSNIFRMYSDRSGLVWIDTGPRGVFNYNRDNDDFSRKNLPENVKTPLLDDAQGALWFGGVSADHESRVLYQLDRTSLKEKQAFAFPKGSFSSLIKQDVRNPQIYWISTYEQGLAKFERDSKKFTYFSHDPNNPKSIAGNSVNQIEVDRTNPAILWLATADGGLNKFDIDKEQFTAYLHQANDPASISSNVIYSFVQTRRGEFWVMAKGGGLEKFDRINGKFEHFNQNNGKFPNDKAVNILEDKNGLLWLNAPGGMIIRFDPVSGRFHQFSKEDGIQEGAAWSGVKAIDATNRLWFGGAMGLNAFYPEEIHESELQPPVYFTSITQNGQPVLTQSATEITKELKINWEKNFFEFEVAALDYTHPERNQYQYMLEGWDQQWYNAENRNYGRYSGISGGEYTLRVRGSNSDGIWSPHEARLRVIVTPPFWKTTWFYVFIASSAVILIVLLFLKRTAAVRAHNTELQERKLELERRVEARTQELRQVMGKLVQSEKIAALSHLVSGIAHELNTPLGNAKMLSTCISDSLQELNNAVVNNRLQREDLDEFLLQNEQAIQILSRNLLRSADLVNNFKQISVVRSSDKPERFNVRQALQGLICLMHAEAKVKFPQIQLDIPDEFEMLSLHAPFERIFTNLIKNSIVHGFAQLESAELGEIRISLELKTDGPIKTLPLENLDSTTDSEPGSFAQTSVVMHFSDNGVGIAEDIQHRIFEPFFTTQLGQGGSGLGLTVVFNLISVVLGGSISLEKTTQKGCHFILVFPLQSEGDSYEVTRNPY